MRLSQETFNGEFFVEKGLTDFDKERTQNRPKKHSSDTFLHLDTATPYRALRDFDCLGITIFPHPYYNPDLAAYYFRLFGTLKRKLKVCTFANPIEGMTEVNTILSKISLEEFILVIDEWKCRLRERIEKERKYL
jgi:hypothetical protein